MKLIITFFLLSFIFGILEKFFPLKTKQKQFRQGWLTDIIHFFINHFFVKLGAYIITVILYTLFSPLVSSFLQERVAYNKNFSGFPLINLLLGTFYLLKNQILQITEEMNLFLQLMGNKLYIL